MVRKHSAANGSHATGKRKETATKDDDRCTFRSQKNEIGQLTGLDTSSLPNSKCPKGSYASNLSKDWRKKINQLNHTGTSSKRSTTDIHAEQDNSIHMSHVDELPDNVIDIPPLSTAAGHSRSSSYSSITHNAGLSTREQSTVSGEFDHDETDEQIAAARKTRGPIGDSTGGRTKGNLLPQQAVNLEAKGRERTTKLVSNFRANFGVQPH